MSPRQMFEALEAYDVEATDEDRREDRIAAGMEQACASCGCSETCPCPGGCVWATANLCSRCV